MRSTRETELAEAFPLHVVTAWMGNTESMAMEHYLQVTAEHFERAVQSRDGQRSGDNGLSSTAKQAAQNPAQQTAETPRGDSRASANENRKRLEVQELATNFAINVTVLKAYKYNLQDSMVLLFKANLFKVKGERHELNL